MGNDPDRLCNDCEMEFSTTSDWFNIMKEISNDEPEKVEMGNVMPENIEKVESLTFFMVPSVKRQPESRSIIQITVLK